MKNWIPTTISIVAIGIAIVAIAKAAPVEGVMDFDYYGAIIGVLSVLVTLLMGYQIYTMVNMKEELKEVRETKAMIDSKLEAKSKELTKVFREELSNAAPLIMSISKNKAELIEKAAFTTYKGSKDGELAHELASETIETILESYAIVKDGDKRSKAIAQLAKIVSYDEVVEYYTDYAKKKDKKAEYEQVLLELIGNITEGKNNGTA